VKPAIAGQAGFTGRVLVATGGHDQPCGALGAGITRPGNAMNATGTSDVICPVFPQPVLSAAMLASNFCCYPHTGEDRCCSIAFNLNGGLLLRWYRDVFCHEEREAAKAAGQDPYDLIFNSMHPEPADVFVLPHLVGAGTPYLDPDSRGSILGLTLETDKPKLARAMVDSINYEMKINIDRYEAAGVAISELRAVGGGAKSAKWLQMKADVFGKPVAALESSEAAATGAAILAGKALGLFKSAAAAAEQLVKVKRVYAPVDAAHRRYLEKYAVYSGIYELLKAFYRKK
jgi:xylulokinase